MQHQRLSSLAALGALVAVAGGAHAATVTSGTLTAFTGADAGEGLDLDGTFAYAVDLGRSSGSVAIRDATFTGSNVTGVADGGTGFDYRSIQSNPLNFGPSGDDADLVDVLNTVSYASNTPVTIGVAVDPGTTYKLQLLFEEVYNRPADDTRHRVQDIQVEGVTAVSGMDLSTETSFTQGLVFTYVFSGSSVGSDGVLNLAVAPVAGSNNDLTVVVNGFTLEVVPEPGSLSLLGLAGLLASRRRRVG